ncbi:MAG: carboxypeptidase-like regulatory domain-containing protein, partial [Saprospiraceae bacterium]|nr:carboxypeptidase-like regulatory domain-containing protein [Saprospiraceae bacterium]
MKAFFLLFCSALIGMSGLPPRTETTLSGLVKDNDTKDPLIGVTIQVTKDRKLIKGAVTDVEGKYRLQLEPGTYEIE